jgi:hypothetical protein
MSQASGTTIGTLPDVYREVRQMDTKTTKVFAFFPPVRIVRAHVMAEYSGSPLEDANESQIRQSCAVKKGDCKNQGKPL